MQWEYFRLSTVEASLDEALRELGLEGWELVYVMPETRLFHGFQCLLKRPYVATRPERREAPQVPERFRKLMSLR